MFTLLHRHSKLWYKHRCISLIVDFPFTVDVIYGRYNKYSFVSSNIIILGLVNSVINLTEKDDPISDQKIWQRSTHDENGWFTLTNPHSGKIVTASGATDLTVTGTGYSSAHLKLF